MHVYPFLPFFTTVQNAFIKATKSRSWEEAEGKKPEHARDLQRFKFLDFRRNTPPVFVSWINHPVSDQDTEEVVELSDREIRSPAHLILVNLDEVNVLNVCGL